jgi:hypothetical protein
LWFCSEYFVVPTTRESSMVTSGACRSGIDIRL